MKLQSQVIAPKTRRLERIFDEFLLSALCLLMISLLSLFLLLEYGIFLFVSEPEPLVSSNAQKPKIGLRIQGSEFQLSFNATALSLFPPGEESNERSDSRTSQALLSQISKTHQAKLSNPARNEGPSYTSNPLQDLKVKIEEDKLIMALPLQISDFKKTITIEETLHIEDGSAVADIKTVYVGKLPIPGTVASSLLDLSASRLTHVLLQQLDAAASEKAAMPLASTDDNRLQLSKLIMPPTLLIIFGPRDLMEAALEGNTKQKHILEDIPTVELTELRIRGNEVIVSGSASQIEQLMYLAVSVLKMKWKELGR